MSTYLMAMAFLLVFNRLHVLLRYMFGKRAKVTYTLHEPYNSVGYITVEGKQIDVKNPKSFIAIVKAASNFEAYPTTSGKIVMNLTYHGLTQAIE